MSEATFTSLSIEPPTESSAVRYPSTAHPSTAHVQPSRYRRVHRGGFSTSICDLFRNPYDRSSCCAIICCGIFLNDRNQYAVNGRIPLSWWQRGLAFVGVLVLTFAVAVAMAILEVSAKSLAFLVGLTVPSFALSAFCTLGRAKFRREIKLKIQEDRSDAAEELPEEQDPEDFCSEERRVHRCCACVPKDIFYLPQQGSSSTASEHGYAAPSEDACSSLWNVIAVSCCGCSGFWCNWCGVCATGQEHRELRRILPPERFEMDYITFQPYQEYAPAIQVLRTAQSTSFWEHLGALSTLSANLLKFLQLALLLLLSLSVLHIFRSFRFSTVLVVVATLAQAFAVLYFVHWYKHRLDLSLDAVIKLFASGFFLAVTIAMGMELLVEQVGDIVFDIVAFTEYEDDNPDANFDDPNAAPSEDEIAYNLQQNHLWAFVIYYAFDSFVVAGLVEELSKYFCFWMVEHPDFDGTFMARENGRDMSSRRSIHSRAAAVTVGMVATAAGFACCENLMYALGMGRSFKKEIGVLLMRSITPVHPLAAAIQSIGIVQRDIEGVGGLGQAILPALLLHGTFDFVLMVMALLLSPIEEPVEGADEEEDYQPPPITVKQIVITLVTGLLITLLGAVYYAHGAKRQRERLSALESTAVAEADESEMCEGITGRDADAEIS